MLEFRFDPQSQLILTVAHIEGPNDNDQVQLVFDTGAAVTQIDHDSVLALGYSEVNKLRDVDISGVTDAPYETYTVGLQSFSTLGLTLINFEVALVDFGKWKSDEIDGLLGWDFIRTLHYEQNGPKGLLTIY